LINDVYLMNPLVAFPRFNFFFPSDIKGRKMSVGTMKEPRSKYGGEVKERWRRGEGKVEELWRKGVMVHS
jgi:hypothetical protein